MTINFYLNTNKSSEERTIFLYLREHGKTIMINTGIKIKEKDWDKKKQIVKKLSNEMHHSYNSALDSLKNNIYKKYLELKENDPNISFDEIKRVLLENKTNKDHTFIELLEKYIQTQQSKVTKGTTQKYNQLKTKLSEYFDKRNIEFNLNTLRPLDIDDFGSFLTKHYKLQVNSMVKVQKTLMSFIRWTNDNGFTKNFFPYKYQKQYIPDKIALTFDELKNFEEIELDKKLDRVRDLFLFHIFTGQRTSDVKKYSKNQLGETQKGNIVWKLVQTKTQKSVEIPLCTKAKNILVKYEFELPRISTQRLNDYVKEIGKLIGMDEKETITLHYGRELKSQEKLRYEELSTHTGRRTFMTLCNYSGINSSIIDSIAGFSKNTMQSRYTKRDHDKSVELLDGVFGV